MTRTPIWATITLFVIALILAVLMAIEFVNAIEKEARPLETIGYLTVDQRVKIIDQALDRGAEAQWRAERALRP